ncbi:Imm41 family immunity protein [Janthinobacterium lividum]|uniref:Imm41 family immunity protein n=1 Tax=Janthinobacterium lividum TaxID=29581 RepID=UPI000FE24A27|nr:Imm41 family immunity protein [Janthinobacterium lividum]
MYEHIFRNFPGNPNWQGSFYERLTEYGDWNIVEFWKLHWDLVEAARSEAHHGAVSRELALAVATLYAKVSSLILAHYNVNDVFLINNLSPDQLLAFTERFEHAMLGVFSGEVIAESSYDLPSPLIAVS